MLYSGHHCKRELPCLKKWSHDFCFVLVTSMWMCWYMSDLCMHRQNKAVIAHLNPMDSHFIPLIQQLDLQINHVDIYVYIYLLHLILITGQALLRECKTLNAVFNKLVKASRQYIFLHYPQKCFEKNNEIISQGQCAILKKNNPIPMMPISQKQQCKGFSDLTSDQFDLHPESWSFP